MSQRYEGRNLEDALNAASQALGVERWQLTYHVLLEKRGFLGGVKRIVIEADVNPAAAPPVAPAAPPEYSAEPPRARQQARGGDRSSRSGGGRGRNDRRDDRRGAGRGPRRRHEETFIGDLPEQGERSEAAQSVVEWIESVISLMRLDLVLRTEERDEQILVRLYGSDSERLTDRHGELLDAIQVLANKALVGRKVEKEIELDCEEFKERRVEDLERRAREVADRVRSARREELLPAMSPIERRIVHVALQDDQDVTTESRGEGFYKRIAIVLRPEGPPRNGQPTGP